jgi:hypothetical protein
VDRRARVIAGVNVMNSAYMVAGGAIVAILQAFGMKVGALFALLGLLAFAFFASVVRAWFTEIARVGRLDGSRTGPTVEAERIA